jgi:hypothetical protein
MTDLSDAFTDDPPSVVYGGKETKLRAYAPLSHKKITRAAELWKDSGEDTAICLGYVVTHAVSPSEAARITADDDIYRMSLDSAAMEISLEDLESVAAYLGRLFTRAAAAQVDTADEPGKGRAA